MKKSWTDLNRPIMCLAPMEGATDTVFRQIIADCGRPDVMFTEFVNVDGLSSAGAERVAQRLLFVKKEKPLVAQLWGLDLENYERVSDLMVEVGFDGVDINMGCPERKVINNGACAALIKDKSMAAKIIAAVKAGVKGRVPVSVKTRIGFGKIETEEWCGFLLDQGIDALIVHGRTVREKSEVPAHWDEIGKVVKLRDMKRLETLILGNGDVMSLAEANEKVQNYNVDGVMIGRGVFQDPWLFSQSKSFLAATREEKLSVLRKHIELFSQTWGKNKNYHELKRYYKIYVRGFDDAATLRVKLMETESIREALELLD